MVLGVAFLSISIQAAALSSYIKRSFPSSQTEELNTRLSKAVANIESLEKLRDEGKLTTEVFASELERQKDELREVLNEIHSNLGTKDILKSRASEIYNSVLTLPMSRAMHVLKIHNLEKPIEGLVDKTKEEGDESAEAAT
jgi:septal ring factor EnvC (AmiA/AmiB activator)